MHSFLCRQQIQHYTNQLAKETNKHLKELGSVPAPLSPSEQVSGSLLKRLHEDQILSFYQNCLPWLQYSKHGVQQYFKVFLQQKGLNGGRWFAVVTSEVIRY